MPCCPRGSLISPSFPPGLTLQQHSCLPAEQTQVPTQLGTDSHLSSLRESVTHPPCWCGIDIGPVPTCSRFPHPLPAASTGTPEQHPDLRGEKKSLEMSRMHPWALHSAFPFLCFLKNNPVSFVGLPGHQCPQPRQRPCLATQRQRGSWLMEGGRMNRDFWKVGSK